jgi:two-component system, NarL family, response regulator LiaR
LFQRIDYGLRAMRQVQFAEDVADVLCISEETVKSHIGNILGKLHLAHRTQAVIYALKQGLISLDELKL